MCKLRNVEATDRHLTGVCYSLAEVILFVPVNLLMSLPGTLIFHFKALLEPLKKGDA